MYDSKQWFPIGKAFEFKTQIWIQLIKKEVDSVGSKFLSSTFQTTELNTELTRVSNDKDQEVSSDFSYGVRQTPE